MQPSKMGLGEWGLLMTLSILWGGSFFFIKLALKELPPFTIVFSWVSLVAAMALSILVWLSGQSMPKSFKRWQEFFVMGALNNLIPIRSDCLGSDSKSSKSDKMRLGGVAMSQTVSSKAEEILRLPLCCSGMQILTG